MRCVVLRTVGLIFGLTIGAGSTVTGQSGASGMSPERLERVAAAIDKHVATGELAGAVSLIYRHGEIAAVSAHGFQDLAARRPMQRDTIFGRASMTKPVTAVAAMILVEKGKIRLDEPVDRWLPGWFFIWPDFFQGAGFGFGVELKTERSNLGPSVGSFWWHGAIRTHRRA